jgi:hypothetical protein
VFYKIEGREKVVGVNDNGSDEDDILFQKLLDNTPELLHGRKSSDKAFLNPYSPVARFDRKIERVWAMYNQNLQESEVAILRGAATRRECPYFT